MEAPPPPGSTGRVPFNSSIKEWLDSVVPVNSTDLGATGGTAEPETTDKTYAVLTAPDPNELYANQHGIFRDGASLLGGIPTSYYQLLTELPPEERQIVESYNAPKMEHYDNDNRENMENDSTVVNGAGQQQQQPNHQQSEEPYKEVRFSYPIIKQEPGQGLTEVKTEPLQPQNHYQQAHQPLQPLQPLQPQQPYNGLYQQQPQQQLHVPYTYAVAQPPMQAPPMVSEPIPLGYSATTPVPYSLPTQPLPQEQVAPPSPAESPPNAPTPGMDASLDPSLPRSPPLRTSPQPGGAPAKDRRGRGRPKRKDIDGNVMDENYRKQMRFHYTKVSLSLICEFQDCGHWSDDIDEFNKHVWEHTMDHKVILSLPRHGMDADGIPIVTCPWRDCEFIGAGLVLAQHISYHIFHTKIKDISKTILEGTSRCDTLTGSTVDFKKFGGQNLCKFTEKRRNTFPDSAWQGMRCLWLGCEHYDLDQSDVMAYYRHVSSHCTVEARAENGKYNCGWRDCKTKGLPSGTKLKDHVKVHTSERQVACGVCGALMANKSKFIDHVTRQLNKHDMNEAGVEGLNCEDCGKWFAEYRLLRDHKRSHDKNRKKPGYKFDKSQWQAIHDREAKAAALKTEDAGSVDDPGEGTSSSNPLPPPQLASLQPLPRDPVDQNGGVMSGIEYYQQGLNEVKVGNAPPE